MIGRRDLGDEMSARRSWRVWIAGLTSHIPPGQFLRYVAVGIWNVSFGYASYAAFTAVLMGVIPYGYLAASLLSSLLNITVAFLGYKWFVFRTKGRYLQEWIRALTLYSGIMALGIVLLPPLVAAVTHITHSPKRAPYVAGAVITALNVCLSFFGHKKFSFRS